MDEQGVGLIWVKDLALDQLYTLKLLYVIDSRRDLILAKFWRSLGVVVIYQS
jgi:hypothetical protein